MDIKEVILCKFGEVVLKGANRQNFESTLVKELRRRASPYGVFKIYFKQSTIYVEPQNDGCDIDGMYEAAKKVFGIVGVNRAAVCEKNNSGASEKYGRHRGRKGRLHSHICGYASRDV